MEYFLVVLTVGLGTAFGLGLIWFLDRFEKEPIWVLALVFLWGAVPAVILTVVVEAALEGAIAYLLDLDPSVRTAFKLIAVAPVVEELAKGLALFAVFLFMRRGLHGVLDGIVYGAVVGLGFGAVEAVQQLCTALYKSGPSQSTIILIFSKVFLFGLMHPAWTACTGVGFGAAWATRRRWLGGFAVLLGLGAAIITHATHNVIYVVATLQTKQQAADACMVAAFLVLWLLLLCIFAIIIYAWVTQWRWVRRELREEVQLGNLSEREFRQVSKWFGRLGWELRFLAAFDVRGFFRIRKMYNLLVKLAFARRACGRNPDDENRRRLDDARRRVAEMRAAFV